MPVANGEPLTCVSWPPTPTANTDTVLLFSSVTASSPPLGLNATPEGDLPVANIEPLSCAHDANAGGANGNETAVPSANVATGHADPPPTPSPRARKCSPPAS